jgi:hypothetical protein
MGLGLAGWCSTQAYIVMEEKVLNYALLSESWVEEFFIPEYLKVFLIRKGIGLQRSPIGNTNLNKKETKGKAYNLKRLPFLSQDFLKETQKNSYPISLFIFGVDFEWEEAGIPIISDQQVESEKSRISKMFEIGTQGMPNNQKVLYIPIRCFETWIWYLKNPNESIGNFEKIKNKDLKTLVYGIKRSSIDKSKDLVKGLLESDSITEGKINHLSTQPPSFHHFHQQITAFIQQIS